MWMSFVKKEQQGSKSVGSFEDLDHMRHDYIHSKSESIPKIPKNQHTQAHVMLCIHEQNQTCIC